MRFKLSNLFAIFHFGFFFSVLVLFIYWQFKTIKEFHDIELNNFFNQTNNMANLLINKEQKEINNLINYNLHNFLSDNHEYVPIDNNTDFVFFTDGKDVLYVDGFSLILDVKIAAQKLKNVNTTDKIINIKIDTNEYYFLVYKQKVLDENIGKVIGEVWGVILLNENQILLEDIRKNLKLSDMILINKNGHIITSTMKKEDVRANITLDKKYEDIIVVMIIYQIYYI